MGDNATDDELKFFNSPSRQNEEALSPPNSAQANDNTDDSLNQVRRRLNTEKMFNSRRSLLEQSFADLKLKEESHQKKKVQEMRQKQKKKRGRQIADRRAKNGLSSHFGQPKIWERCIYSNYNIKKCWSLY